MRKTCCGLQVVFDFLTQTHTHKTRLIERDVSRVLSSHNIFVINILMLSQHYARPRKPRNVVSREKSSLNDALSPTAVGNY